MSDYLEKDMRRLACATVLLCVAAIPIGVQGQFVILDPVNGPIPLPQGNQQPYGELLGTSTLGDVVVQYWNVGPGISNSGTRDCEETDNEWYATVEIFFQSTSQGASWIVYALDIEKGYSDFESGTMAPL